MTNDDSTPGPTGHGQGLTPVVAAGAMAIVPDA
jgi:hypothetical protein